MLRATWSSMPTPNPSCSSAGSECSAAGRCRSARSSCATSRPRPATPSSIPPWRAESPRATTSSPSCWRRGRARGTSGHERDALCDMQSGARYPGCRRRVSYFRWLDLPAPLRRCVPRVAVASRTTVCGGVADATAPLGLASGTSNGVWRRMAIQASEEWRRMATQASEEWRRMATQASDEWRLMPLQASDGEWRWMAVHALDGVCPELLIHHAPEPATSNAPAPPIAMRRRVRRPKEGGRMEPPAGRLLTAPDIGRGLDPLVRAGGWGGRRLRHIEQTPWSPGSGVYKAPQLVHPSTEFGVSMLPIYRTARADSLRPGVALGLSRLP